MSTLAPAIVVVPSKHGEGAYFEAKWRDRDGRQVKRRVGQAWLERDPRSGEWVKRRGRTPAGWLDERTVHVAAAELVERVEQERAEAARAAALGEPPPFTSRRRRCETTRRCCASRARPTRAVQASPRAGS